MSRMRAQQHYIPFEQADGVVISAEDQATMILERALNLQPNRENPSVKVGIPYSANEDEMGRILRAYARGEQPSESCFGDNQGGAMKALVNLLSTHPRYQPLQTLFRIQPIPTLKYGGFFRSTGPVTAKGLRESFSHLLSFMSDGRAHLIGWKNREDQEYFSAIGGNIAAAVQPSHQKEAINFMLDNIKARANGVPLASLPTVQQLKNFYTAIGGGSHSIRKHFDDSYNLKQCLASLVNSAQEHLRDDSSSSKASVITLQAAFGSIENAKNILLEVLEKPETLEIPDNAVLIPAYQLIDEKTIMYNVLEFKSEDGKMAVHVNGDTGEILDVHLDVQLNDTGESHRHYVAEKYGSEFSDSQRAELEKLEQVVQVWKGNHVPSSPPAPPLRQVDGENDISASGELPRPSHTDSRLEP